MISSDSCRFFVVFGAPGAGKTTLLSKLRERSAKSEGPFYFITLDEPTRLPHIVSLLTRMYVEMAQNVPAAESIAAHAQTAIMQERVLSFKKVELTLASELAVAIAQNKRLVIVCDGHLHTDDKLYVRSKYDAGQINAEQFAAYELEKAALLAGLPLLSAEPTLFCHLMIEDDANGLKHYHRVCEQRKDSVETGVPPETFARLARYATETAQMLKAQLRTLVTLNTDGKEPDEVVDEFTAIVAATMFQ